MKERTDIAPVHKFAKYHQRQLKWNEYGRIQSPVKYTADCTPGFGIVLPSRKDYKSPQR